ncbi:MAG TPA: RDD family protein [Pusillimonas sp.]|nr:RDD family protein [Pusillimonas sp.]HBT32406.1 RDD family protein [Pusillimonas sp.]HCN71859.1 RDD family protein [Pusillimonas sp.]HCP77904.1 RDD family protein [Pusillimonas sp.]
MQNKPQEPSQPRTLITPSRWRRFSSMMYEGVLLFAVVFLASYLFDTLTQSRSGLMFRHERQVALFIAIGIYFVLSWKYKGQTLPMKTWNIRLIDKNGLPPTVGRLTLRYILVWPIPLISILLVQGLSRITGYASTDLLIVFTPFTLFIWTWFDAERQFLHDRLLGTRLISV